VIHLVGSLRGIVITQSQIIATAILNVALDALLWLRVGGNSNASGRKKHLTALGGVSFASATFLIVLLAGRLGLHLFTRSFGMLASLVGLAAAGVGFIGGLALSNEPSRRAGMCIAFSAMMAGFLWFLAAVGSTL